MIAQTERRAALETRAEAAPLMSTTAVSALVGVLCGGLFAWLGASVPQVGMVALFLMGLALSFVVTPIVAARINENGRLRWDLLFTGQIVGVLGAVLFFFTAVG